MNDPRESPVETVDTNSASKESIPGDSRGSTSEVRHVSQIGHLQCIDFLRGVASLGVVVFHTSHSISHKTTDLTITWLHKLSSYGVIGVPLFFVISGFCIHRKQAERSAAGLDDSISFRKYWKRRFFRLYPSYFVVCVGSALLMLVAIARGSESTVVSRYPGNPYYYLTLDFLTHILMIHGFFSLFDTGLGNGSLWTLAREEQYYLLYFPLLKIKKYAGVLVCLIISICASYIMFRMVSSVSDDNPGLKSLLITSSLSNWPQWVLGMVSMEMLVNRKYSLGLLGNRLAILAGLALLIWHEEYPGTYLTNVLLLGFGCFFIVTSLSKIEGDGHWIRNKAVRMIESAGQYSYSMYLVNYPLLVILGRPARSMGSNRNMFMYIVFMAIGIAVCNLAGFVLYYLVERHGQRKPGES